MAQVGEIFPALSPTRVRTPLTSNPPNVAIRSSAEPGHRPHLRTVQPSIPNRGMRWPWDETLIKDVEREFRQEGERAATRLAISFLMGA
jgi:hypothetical protein